MVDMLGLIIVFAVLKLLVDHDYLTTRNYKTAMAIGLMLTLLLFTRRWYIFWVVAYFPTVFVVNVIWAISKRNMNGLVNSVVSLSISEIIIVDSPEAAYCRGQPYCMI